MVIKQYLVINYYWTGKLGYLPKEKKGNFRLFMDMFLWNFLHRTFVHLCIFFFTISILFIRHTHLSNFLRFLCYFYYLSLLFLYVLLYDI